MGKPFFVLFCFWSRLKQPRFLKKLKKSWGLLVCMCFLSNLIESRRIQVDLVFCNLKETRRTFLSGFEVVWKNLVNILCLVFEVVCKNLEDLRIFFFKSFERVLKSLSLMFEVLIRKNPWETFFSFVLFLRLKQSRILKKLKKFWGLLVCMCFLSILIESRRIQVDLVFCNLKETRGNFLSGFEVVWKNLVDILCLVFEVVCKNLEDLRVFFFKSFERVLRTLSPVFEVVIWKNPWETFFFVLFCFWSWNNLGFWRNWKNLGGSLCVCVF